MPALPGQGFLSVTIQSRIDRAGSCANAAQPAAWIDESALEASGSGHASPNSTYRHNMAHHSRNPEQKPYDIGEHGRTERFGRIQTGAERLCGGDGKEQAKIIWILKDPEFIYTAS